MQKKFPAAPFRTAYTQFAPLELLKVDLAGLGHLGQCTDALPPMRLDSAFSSAGQNGHELLKDWAGGRKVQGPCLPCAGSVVYAPDLSVRCL